MNLCSRRQRTGENSNFNQNRNVDNIFTRGTSVEPTWLQLVSLH